MYLLTVKETAAMLRVSKASVARLLTMRKIPGTMIGGSWRIDRDSLIEWMNKGGNGGTGNNTTR